MHHRLRSAVLHDTNIGAPVYDNTGQTTDRWSLQEEEEEGAKLGSYGALKTLNVLDYVSCLVT